MKTWRRASLEIPCGAERGCSILPDEPYLLLSGASGWRKVRCGRHAGEAIPADIPAGPMVQAPPRQTRPAFTAVAELAARFDSRKAAANDGD